MNKSKKIPTLTIPSSEKIPDSSFISVSQRPIIGITYCYIQDANYGLKSLLKYDKNHSNENVLKKFAHFLEIAAKSLCIQDFVDTFASRHKVKNGDKKSKQILQDIQKKYNIETGEMYHLHFVGGGYDKFTVHGFIIYNRFEIVLFDPNHDYFD